MTDLKGPSGKVIRDGDTLTLKPVRAICPSHGIPYVMLPSGGTTWLNEEDIASHEPAPLPLKPGPALLNCGPGISHRFVSVIAIHEGVAWVRYDDTGGDEHVLASRLQNVEAG